MSDRARLPNRRPHEVVEFSHAGFHYAAGIGRFENGELAEIFLSSPKTGTSIEAQARDLGIVASIGFQHGAGTDVIRHSLSRDDGGAPASALAALLDLLAGGGA